jgi:hypothetical protein
MEIANETSIQKKLLIGIVLPNKKYSTELNDFINWCLENPHIEIRCIVSLPLENYKKGIAVFWQKILWKIILSLEGFLATTFNRNNEPLLNNFHALEKIKKIPIDSLSYQRIEQLNPVKECDLDLLVAFELNDYCKHLRNQSKLGLLGFHHTECADQSNYPLYFEEVLKKKNKTNFSIIQMMPKMQNAKLIREGSFVTRGLFLSNKKM